MIKLNIRFIHLEYKKRFQLHGRMSTQDRFAS
jgi:hypothetical protein